MMDSNEAECALSDYAGPALEVEREMEGRREPHEVLFAPSG